LAAGIKLQVLDVGQGSGNFLEFYDVNGTLTTTMLFDLGSEHASKTAGAGSVKYIIETLQGMAEPTIDTVILSHSDSDHINLMGQLFDTFSPPGTVGKNPNEILRIKRAYYGGDRNLYKKGKTKKSFNVITRLEKYLTDTKDEGANSLSSNDSSFYDLPARPLRIVDGVLVFLMVGNILKEAVTKAVTKKRKAPDGYTINTKSLVLLVYYKGVQMLITGDATGVTLVKCNEIINMSGAEPYFDNVFMVTAPHHGSATTTFDVCGLSSGTLDTGEYAQDNLTSFVNSLKAQTLSASAERANFKHPSARVLSFFWPKLSSTIYYTDPTLATEKRHFYTAYFLRRTYDLVIDPLKKEVEKWPPSPKWYTVQTSANVFTTLYFVADFQKKGVVLPPSPANSTDPIATGPALPALGLQWAFGIDETGTKSVAPVVNRELALAAGLPLLAASLMPVSVPPVSFASFGVGGQPVLRSALTAARASLPASATFGPQRIRPVTRDPESVPVSLRRLKVIA
jgi:beta-lactamase superfamily II metal-dependent hydrolase